MKILVCHNYYQQAGGEDNSFADEARMLERNGHEVIRFTKHNDSIKEMGRFQIARKTFWNEETAQELDTLIRDQQPSVMHCTNTFPLISPAAYYVARRHNVAVVQSLRNYRLLCPGAYFMRDGRVCEDCLGKIPWRSIAHGCYRGSRAGSAVLAGMLTWHRMKGTWTKVVNRYYALTKFAQRKFIEAGFPEQKIMLKPNFVDPDPGAGSGQGDYAVFVGRLSPEKGVETLVNAWSVLEQPVPLKIVGDGPLHNQLATQVRENPMIELCGWQEREAVNQIVGSAKCLILPSLWYEGFPKTILEAFSLGTPVIASNLGSMTELIEHGRTGMLFTPGSAAELARNVSKFINSDTLSTNARRWARDEYLSKYTATANYKILMRIYDQARGDLGEDHHAKATSMS